MIVFVTRRDRRTRPTVPDATDGLRRLRSTGLIDALRSETTSGVRALLAFFAVFLLVAGLWQAFWPASFFADFPGFGHHWVDVDGPYNEHLLRDVGQGNLGIAAAALYATVRPTRLAARLVALAVSVPAVPHVWYHLVHVHALPHHADQVLQTVALVVTAALALLLLALTFRRPAQVSRPIPSPSRSRAAR
jgi:hypothetical protein